MPIPIQDRFIKATQIVDKWGTTMMIYSLPGVGKTTLAATAQESEYGRDVIFLDCEGGASAIRDRADITIFRPMAFREVREFFDFVAGSKHRFKTIVVDTLSELQKLNLKEIVRMAGRSDGMPQLQDYGMCNEQMTAMIRNFKDLAQRIGVNVIFNCHVVETRDGESGPMVARPMLTPGLVNPAMAALDFVGYLTRDSKGVRTLRLAGSDRFLAKTRIPLSWEQLSEEIENPSLVPILAHGREEAKKHQKP